MANKKKESISTILLGDQIGELARNLDVGESDQKLIAILICPGKVRVSTTPGLGKAEIIGALNLAIDEFMRIEW